MKTRLLIVLLVGLAAIEAKRDENIKPVAYTLDFIVKPN